MGYWKEETKELTKKCQGTDQVVVIRKLNAGDNTDIGKSVSNMNITPGLAKGTIDMHMGRMFAVHKSILKADFPHATMDDIRSIPGEFFEWLYSEVSKFNTVNQITKKVKLEGPSSSEQKT